jgi:hypothetical protein
MNEAFCRKVMLGVAVANFGPTANGLEILSEGGFDGGLDLGRPDVEDRVPWRGVTGDRSPRSPA